jgi:hypothetical protein
MVTSNLPVSSAYARNMLAKSPAPAWWTNGNFNTPVDFLDWQRFCDVACWRETDVPFRPMHVCD